MSDPAKGRKAQTLLILSAFSFLSMNTLAFGQSSATPVMTWGSNSNGQLGRSNAPANMVPAAVMGLGTGSGVIAIAAGSNHSLVLKSDGTVLAWGSNASGQLGDGTTVSKSSPVQVNGLGSGSGVIAIAAGVDHSLALKADGTVLAWGGNSSGQLGDGTTTQRNSAVQVSGLGPSSSVIAIAIGLGSHCLALKADGTVLAWGSNSSGQLGDGTTTLRLSPVPVSGLGSGSGVVAITAGGNHSLARKSNGTVMGWGANSNGQLGDGSTARRLTPVQVSTFGAGSGIVAVAADSSYSMALRSDGTVWAWGANSTGQLGDGTATQRTTPIQVSDASGVGFLTNASAIAVGGAFSFSIQTDGGVFAWGFNSVGQLGDGTFTTRTRPVQITGLAGGSGVVRIAGGDSHSMALKSDGRVLTWGANNMGQLGRGAFDLPLSIPAFPDVDVIAAGAAGSHNLARKSDGSVWSWGLNGSGQLGDGTTTTRTTPVQVTGLGVSSNVSSLSAGSSHSLALKLDGTVLAWGANSNGQLGDGTTISKMNPVQVTGFGPNSGITAVAAGASHNLALSSDGSLWAWGSNSSGQLGDGTTVQKTVPVRVTGFGPGSGVIGIAAGNSHSLAVKSDGTLWAWGANNNGQLGDGSSASRAIPVQVVDVSGVGFLTGITTVGTGSFHTLALKADGSTLAWGSNASGQLGDGSTIQRNIPVQVSAPAFTKIVGGVTHTVAIRSNGDVWAWGSNASGQLGDVTLTDRRTPVQSVVRGTTAIAAGSAHTVSVVAPTPSDTTLPLINATVVGTAGLNNWFRSDVAVIWTTTDPESGISSRTGCASVTLSAETPGTIITCTAVNSAGLSASASVTIKIDKTAPVVSSTRTTPNANGWNKTAVTVSFSAVDALSGIDGPASAMRTISTEGKNQSATATFADAAGNTVTTNVDGINIDTTAPALQFGVPSPPPNAAGWNKSDVQFGFTTSDNLSGVQTTSIPGPLVLSGEGANISGNVVVFDAAGNSVSFSSPAVKIDRTAPSASAVASPAPGPTGWNTTDVTVTFSGSDNGSGIASCSAPVVLSSNGANQSASGECTDKAGNVSQRTTVSGINIDKTPARISGLPAADCSIWPPDKRMVQIATINAAGIAAGSLSFKVTSNETTAASDIVVSGNIVQVRADRDGKGTGRIYTVAAQAMDLAGRTISVAGACTVPHDQEREKPEGR
jgi:alpha-tubulin suppressor-like RCC1 family protein